MDCFISYSHEDSAVAKRIHSSLSDLGVTTFLAELSLRGGDNWTDEIWANLREAQFVVFLASEESCKSQFVLQELGGARYDKKTIIPVVWDMSPSRLPAWVNQSHAIDLRGKDASVATELFTSALADLKAGTSDLQQIIWAVVAFVVLAILAARPGGDDLPVTEDPLACPNCSSASVVFKMSPIPSEFHSIEGATHECTKCKHRATPELAT